MGKLNSIGSSSSNDKELFYTFWSAIRSRDWSAVNTEFSKELTELMKKYKINKLEAFWNHFVEDEND